MPARIMAVYGTRPEAIKLAPVARLLHHHPDVIYRSINTGQHRELMPTVMEKLGAPPSCDLNLIAPGQPIYKLHAQILEKLPGVLEQDRPDALIVQGDTATAVMAAWAAFHLNIPVAHVEAGLRTYQPASPFPEETYRRSISTFSTWNFAPTATAAKNLLSECAPGRTIITGNTVVDALFTLLSWDPPSICLPPKEKLFRVISTIHRRENFPHLPDIFRALAALSHDPRIELYMPLHPNPAVVQGAHTGLQDSLVHLIPPMDYHAWIHFIKTADVLISDSGGIQEEAPILGIPLLIARTETERPEAIAGNHAALVGHDPHAIVTGVYDVLEGRRTFNRGNPFGDGKASKRIVNNLLQDLLNR